MKGFAVLIVGDSFFQQIRWSFQVTQFEVLCWMFFQIFSSYIHLLCLGISLQKKVCFDFAINNTQPLKQTTLIYVYIYIYTYLCALVPPKHHVFIWLGYEFHHFLFYVRMYDHPLKGTTKNTIVKSTCGSTPSRISPQGFGGMSPLPP